MNPMVLSTDLLAGIRHSMILLVFFYSPLPGPADLCLSRDSVPGLPKMTLSPLLMADPLEGSLPSAAEAARP